MGLKKNTVVLESNYETWKKMFEKEKIILKDLFNDYALEIEHIGSTSVPNLLAKPIVDIALAVNNFDSFENIRNEVEKIYTVKDNKDVDEILLIKEDNDITNFLIHVMPIDSKRYKDTISFRDCLIKNPNILKEYEILKQELAQKYKDDRKMYTKSKNDFIQDVLKRYKGEI